MNKLAKELFAAVDRKDAVGFVYFCFFFLLTK